MELQEFRAIRILALSSNAVSEEGSRYICIHNIIRYNIYIYILYDSFII